MAESSGWAKARGLMEWGSHFESGWRMLLRSLGLSGSAKSTEEERRAKGEGKDEDTWYDEREFQKLLEKLTADERMIIAGFLPWEFPTRNADLWTRGKADTAFQEFRLAVIGMDFEPRKDGKERFKCDLSGGDGRESDSKGFDTGTSSTSGKSKGGKKGDKSGRGKWHFAYEREREPETAGTKHALTFLRRIVKIIRAERNRIEYEHHGVKKRLPNTPGNADIRKKCLEGGYKAAARYLRDTGMPHMPEDDELTMWDRAREVWEKAAERSPRLAAMASNGVISHAKHLRELETRESGWNRALRALVRRI